ncbi:hypothetical protein [Actinoplanes regularis]|uniref:Uncharacterized protein n=1 Tax=Actinoplanes regularis TaxID=52697 RepID=A0A239FU19_9ACTN|nr:hypothetical protein [Actinoplanes regularis]GIE90161.1 hypothetical protein Are01nite_66410 [Actinoplanes regularis]SNS59652.1 hypothetical protein SAMN06264365_11925 [Actinoplanes regularis]
MSSYVAGGFIGVAVLVVVLIGVRVARRWWPRRALDRDDIRRQAALATKQLAKGSRRARRGTMRGGGTGVGSEPNSAAMLSNDGPVGLP